MNQHLAKLKDTMKNLEQKINESKQSYSASLKRLEVLNTEMHERRSTHSVSRHHLDPRQVSSTGTSPEMRRAHMQLMRAEDVASVDSLQLSKIAADYSGSTESLPSIGALSNSELSQTSEYDTGSLEMPLPCSKVTPNRDVGGSSSQGWNGVPWHQNKGVVPHSQDHDEALSSTKQEQVLSNEDLGIIPSSQGHDRVLSDMEQEVVPPDRDKVSCDCDLDVTSHNVMTTENSLVSLNSHCTSSVVSEREQCSHVASDLVVQCLTTALSRLNQEDKTNLDTTLS